jgi:hypothetical protein
VFGICTVHTWCRDCRFEIVHVFVVFAKNMNACTCNCTVYAVQARLLSYRMMLRRVMFTLYTRSSVVTINLCVIIVVDVDTLLKYTVAF